MGEFRKVAAAQFSPTECAFCRDHVGPFIDTGVEMLGHGHVYICAANGSRSGCVRQLARLDDMIDVEIVQEQLALVDVLEKRIADLEVELRESKVVPMQEVIELLKERKTTPTKKKEPETVVQ